MTDERNGDEIARSWIAFCLWHIEHPSPRSRGRQELADWDREAEANGASVTEAIDALVRSDPEQGWQMILHLVDMAPNARALASVAAGPLENVLERHPYEFIDRIEQRAKSDPKFRRCLSGVWGWNSIPDDVQARMRRTWRAKSRFSSRISNGGCRIVDGSFVRSDGQRMMTQPLVDRCPTC